MPNSKTSASVPSGSTATVLPLVNRLAFVGRMFLGSDQVAPESVVRENMASPRNAKEWPEFGLMFSPGFRSRSQTT